MQNITSEIKIVNELKKLPCFLENKTQSYFSLGAKISIKSYFRGHLACLPQNHRSQASHTLFVTLLPDFSSHSQLFMTRCYQESGQQEACCAISRASGNTSTMSLALFCHKQRHWHSEPGGVFVVSGSTGAMFLVANCHKQQYRHNKPCSVWLQVATSDRRSSQAAALQVSEHGRPKCKYLS